MIYIGIDPGKSGGIALIKPSGIRVMAMPDAPNKIVSALRDAKVFNSFVESRVYIETLTMRRGEGVVSSTTAAKNYGILIGILTAQDVPVEEVTAQAWQKVMLPGKPHPTDRMRELVKIKIKSREDCLELDRLKQEHRRYIKMFAAERASALFPTIDLRRTPKCAGPHDGIVDALLIAEYHRRMGEQS